MENRINILETEPAATKAMYGLAGYIEKSALTKTHQELIKLRASQINGCAFCIDMHTTDALKHGETTQRIVLLNAWREVSDLYTKEERIVLALTDAVTLIHQEGIPTDLYKEASETFDDNYLAQIIMAIVTINSWNRIAISGLFQPAK
ncbi:carboxymuconolactone decarboxylase family protein [Fluviicola taffensis]|uniref:Alkylhydroperoxidase like protein, AhpD family n=1 Tax=Fluviicola taffensis (strain DSM 16823 / NCIMB 13979 / RW262) TaxID=755732 RepID=F2IE32_FLUTR|nr:carboxymuconolactone decarboxylase family protein [Fluviicola taffensis]AEA45596.1 alkylhydroperoxidase like protein, AhpD family [Fluviicola taffensis DSM 16823]